MTDARDELRLVTPRSNLFRDNLARPRLALWRCCVGYSLL